MPSADWKIVYLTAGAGGMYCGSCMHDNTLVREMSRIGVDVQLVPTYTPIRTDEESVAGERLFFGGINVYLQYKYPWLTRIPGLAWLLDRPWIVRWATSRDVSTDPKELGGLAVSMLKGEGGVLRHEVDKLARWLRDEVRPNLIVLSNMLIGGCIPRLKEWTRATIVVTLQGDDIFLRELPDADRAKSLAEIHRLIPYVDGFLVNSHYYGGFMAEFLGIPPERTHCVPLGIDTREFDDSQEFHHSEAAASDPARPLTVGYLARLAPEKGLHVLVEAFLRLRQMPGTEDARLKLAGWLGERNRSYAEEQFARLREAGLTDAFEYFGAVDRVGKLKFLRQIDVLSVPATYRDPKGLFVLEALAAGVPVVQPNHGAFPELLADLGGGRLCTPEDPVDLANQLHALLRDKDERQNLATAGRTVVRSRRNALTMVEQTLAVFDAVRNGASQRPERAIV